MDVECEWKCPLESRGIEAVVVGVAAMAVVEEAAAMEEVVEAVVDQGRVTLPVLRHNQRMTSIWLYSSLPHSACVVFNLF